MHITNLVDETQRNSPLDTPFPVSFFTGPSGAVMRQANTTLRQLADAVETTRAPSKAALPWLKLAQFGDRRSAKGSLRHDANVAAITGVELDCDDGVSHPAEAARRLQAAGVAALVYTSPSHSIFAPRWRVVAPLSRPVPPAERDRLAGVLNAVVGGVAAPESFVLSQGYYYGDAGGDDHHTILVDGAPLDAVQGVSPVYPNGRQTTRTTATRAEVAHETVAPPSVEAVVSLLGRMHNGFEVDRGRVARRPTGRGRLRHHNGRSRRRDP